VPPAPEVLLADADVLIDYRAGDLSVLGMVAAEFGGLYVLRPVLDTVEGLGERDCTRLGIQLVDVETSILLEAGAKSGPLSFEDWLAVIVCRRESWTCVTNDRTLIRECRRERIRVRRGLGLMVELVSRGILEAKKAIRIAQAIHESNPFHINEGVLDAFQKALRRRSD
jgi:hypothetical protein